MRTVKELNKEELDELRGNLYHKYIDEGDEDTLELIDDPSDIPDDVVYRNYEGVYFVEEDFFCNIK